VKLNLEESWMEKAALRKLSKGFFERLVEWEPRGRGRKVWDYPVALEPPFRYLWIDAKVNRWHGDVTFSEPPDKLYTEEPESPLSCIDPDDLVEFSIAVPALTEVSKESSEQFLLNLGVCSGPVSFDIISLPERVAIGMACVKQDRELLMHQLNAFFPEAVITEANKYFMKSLAIGNRKPFLVMDFGLNREFFRPIKLSKNYDPDPWIGILGGLSTIKEGEAGFIQVLFQKADQPWSETLLERINAWEYCLDEVKDLAAVAGKKFSRPIFSVNIRAGAMADTEKRIRQIAQGIQAGLTQFSDPQGNEFVPLPGDEYPELKDIEESASRFEPQESKKISPNLPPRSHGGLVNNIVHLTDLFSRDTHRSGMLLNSEELVSLVHLPTASVRSDKIRPKEGKTKAAPSIVVREDGCRIGGNYHRGKSVGVSLTAEQKISHTYIVGATRTGKSTLLLSMIIQDIANGHGVAVLDPHGDLIDQIFPFIIPKLLERPDDIILFDPSDVDYPIGFNILSAHSELEKNLLSSDLVAVFRRLSTSWGDQMNSVLANAILAFLESEQGGTLLDLQKFLIDRDFRERFLRTVKDQRIVYFWQKEFPLLRDRPQAPILTRLDAFLRPKFIRYMVAQKENKLDFRKILDEGKIFLGKLSQGAIGEENAWLLGSFLVSKFHQAAIARQDIEESKRKNYYLYIDEFHNFVTPSLSSILSGARKYHLGLILSHQELRQLWSRDPEIASAVLTNPFTRICFRLGDFDAQKLAEGFSSFTSQDLQNLGTGEAICRVERAQYDFNLRTAVPYVTEEGNRTTWTVSPVPPKERLSPAMQSLAKEARNQLIELCRQKYGAKREQVEALLTEAIPSQGTSEVVVEKDEKPKTEVPKKEEAVIPQPSIVRKPTQEDYEKRVEQAQKIIKTAALGRGGDEHKRLQHRFKKLAEDKGYRATLEKPVLDNKGNVDVALEKEGQSIAVEISITSTPEQELGNIRKCLEAGFGQIFMVSLKTKNLNQVKGLASSSLKPDELAKVKFMSPDDFAYFLEGIDAKSMPSDGSTVRGFKVQKRFQPVTEEEKKARKQTIVQTIFQALKRVGRR